MNYDVISLGLNAVDVLIRMPRDYKKNDKQMVDTLIIQGGAPTASGACGVSRLGYRVGYVARLGDNTLSAVSIEEFAKSGIDEGLFVRDTDSQPAVALVEIDPDTADRTVFIQMDNYGYLKREDIPVKAIPKSRVLLVDSYDLEATETALRAAQGSPCRTVLDFESGDVTRLRKLLALGTDPILPLAAAKHITGLQTVPEALRALADLTPGQVLITDGLNGSWAWDRDREEILHQPAFRTQSVDSTGCGDAFHAGYIVGILEEWPLNLRMEFGALLASCVSTRTGGRSALPWRNEIQNLLIPEVSSELQETLTQMQAS